MTQDLPSPVMLLKAALHGLPPALLRPALGAVMRAMQRQHAPLFRRLTRLPPATILFDPVDTPHCFLLRIGKGSVRMELAPHGQTASARISGKLATLLQLLEGRIDSDTLFFSRAVSVSGDTAVAVGFRNTLDGESISLMNDALRIAGPFAAPVRRAVLALDRHVGGVRQELTQRYHAMHEVAHDGRDLAAEHDALAAELNTLREKIARTTASSRRRLGQAA